MRTNNTKRTARTTAKKVNMLKGAKGLTTQVGLIPAVKFLQQHGLESAIQHTLKHKRGANALYDVVEPSFSA